MESLVYIGGRILEERKRLRLTQQDVADFVESQGSHKPNMKKVNVA
ncbi:hypothetical protein [Methylophaga thiooxydans]|uniref:Uncharacterized protein n=1 Tax=Methylophaga thiooxydans DMS010 TaxID=637616 RepID=C0N8P0_9GAMM|nr:hypothetical protein [Methylophaga thiooxydans]EEF78798.1 hypothetical protein MDMS009_2542 [Methylophaga thiooxydans DMS010]